MFQNDYLMRMIMQFIQTLQRALRDEQSKPAERAQDLEQVIGDAVNIDPRLLLSMDPDSVVMMLQTGDFDEQIGEYVLRSLYTEAELLDEAGQSERATLRRAQADAIAEAYNIGISIDDVTPEALEAFFAEQSDETASGNVAVTNYVEQADGGAAGSCEHTDKNGRTEPSNPR